MLGIDKAVLCEDQPIGGHDRSGRKHQDAATMLGDSRYLTSWFDPSNLGIQTKHNQLTANSPDLESKIISCWEYVKGIPYTQFVRSKAVVEGKVFQQDDAWLDAGQAINVPKLNCMNKSILLANLLRQDLSPSQVYICLNNVRSDGVGGHAVCYLRLSRDYVLETTNPKVKTPFMEADDLDIYEAVLFFNDSEVKRIEGIALREPFGTCCLRWLADYIDAKYCTEWV